MSFHLNLLSQSVLPSILLCFLLFQLFLPSLNNTIVLPSVMKKGNVGYQLVTCLDFFWKGMDFFNFYMWIMPSVWIFCCSQTCEWWFFQLKFMQLNLKLFRPLVHVQQYRYSYVLLSFSQLFVSHKDDLSSHTNQVPNGAHGALIWLMRLYPLNRVWESRNG
jgi:hypothetical protein